MTEEIKTPATEENKIAELPRTENPIEQFNPKTSMYWVGIPLDKIDALNIILLFDRLKSNAVIRNMQVIQMKSKIMIDQNGGNFNKLKNMLNLHKK